jgi:EAL domain-containing protein (putative c-di-GMP-specific phosphodiesterase class I)
MLHNPAHAAIVRSIIDLGHNLELRVVGEGVESNHVLASCTTLAAGGAAGGLVSTVTSKFTRPACVAG